MSADGQLRHVTRGLEFSTPTGEELHTATAWFRSDGGDRLRVLVSWAQWERVAREQLCGLDATDTPTDLIPDVDVVLDMELHPDAAVTLPDEQSTLRTRLADPAAPLRETSTWRLTAVHQQAPMPEEWDPTNSVGDEATAPRPHATALDLVQWSSPGHTESTTERTEPGVDASESAVETSAKPRETEDETGLETVRTALDTAGWPYEVSPDGSRVSLVASCDGHEWPVHVQSGDREGWWTVRSTHPDQIPTAGRPALASQLLAANHTVERGGFEIDDETGAVAFRTPLVLATGTVSDVIGESLTAMAEWFEAIEQWADLPDE